MEETKSPTHRSFRPSSPAVRQSRTCGSDEDRRLAEHRDHADPVAELEPPDRDVRTDAHTANREACQGAAEPGSPPRSAMAALSAAPERNELLWREAPACAGHKRCVFSWKTVAGLNREAESWLSRVTWHNTQLSYEGRGAVGNVVLFVWWNYNTFIRVHHGEKNDKTKPHSPPSWTVIFHHAVNTIQTTHRYWRYLLNRWQWRDTRSGKIIINNHQPEH